MDNQPQKIICSSIIELIMELGGDALGIGAKYKAWQATPKWMRKEKDWKTIIEAKLKPYLNVENISLIIKDEYLHKIKEEIVKGIAGMENNYFLHMERTPDNQDMVINVCIRNADASTSLYGTYYLRSLTQTAIMNFVQNLFFKHAGNNQPTAELPAGTTNL